MTWLLFYNSVGATLGTESAMRKLSLVLSTALLPSYLFAATIEVQDSRIVPYELSQITEVLTDYDRTCDSSMNLNPCLYHGHQIRTSTLLERSQEGSMETLVFWQHVDAFRDSRQYMITKVNRLDDGSMTIVSYIPSEAVKAQLKAKHGLTYGSPLTGLDAKWVLTPLPGGGTRVAVTLVATHEIRFGGRIASNQINTALNRSINEAFDNLGKYQPAPSVESPAAD